ncbi:DUF371 domain-containing protein [Candidatus Bathyarchaeota archaeon]|nr:DUF371 domain-containing protein [Candidatus Bathyarchaeota archaeon]
MQITECVTASGHKNVRATHRTTLEITKEKELSVRGNCIVAVSADKGFSDLKPEFRDFLCRENARLTMLIDAGGVVDVVKAFGSPKLILSHPTDMVVRKSGYVCGKTLAINADKAAYDLSRALVRRLQSPEQRVKITLIVEV